MSCVELSIVIPAYNAAASLPRALDSLVDARFLGRYEVLVVDDGSTDNTAEVCDNWCRLHPGIACCIRQGNGGVSSARNLGIAAANGDYIAFVDADDYAAPGYLGMAFDAMRGGEDYITFDYVRESDNSQTVVKPQLSPSDIGRARALALTCTANSPWSRLYKKALTKGVLFPLGQSLGEDLCFNLAFLEKARTAAYSPQTAYVYVANEGSRTERPPSASDAEDYGKMYAALMSFCDACGLGEAERNEARLSMARILANYAGRLKRHGVLSTKISAVLESIEGLDSIRGAVARDCKDRARLAMLRRGAYSLAALFLRGY